MIRCSLCSCFIHYRCTGYTNIGILEKMLNDEPGNYVCKICLPNLDPDAYADLVQHSTYGKVWRYADDDPENSVAPSAPLDSSDSSISKIVAAVVKELLPQLTSLIFEQTREMSEKESKKKNLVVLGLPENPNASDLDMMKQVCASVSVSPTSVHEVLRDGPAQPGRPRILKVKFQDLASRRKFLVGFRGAAQGLAGFGKSWVRPDLTFRERQQDRVLRAELGRRRDAGENVIIKGGKIVPKLF